MRRAIIAAALALAGGIAIGRVTAPASPPVVIAAPSAARAPVAPAFAPTCVARLDDSDLRRLRDEVVAALADHGPPAPPVALPPDEPAPAALVATAELERQLDAALAVGRWTDGDLAALRAAGAPPEAYAAAMQRLAMEVNRGRLRVETTGAPF